MNHHLFRGTHNTASLMILLFVRAEAVEYYEQKNKNSQVITLKMQQFTHGIFDMIFLEVLLFFLQRHLVKSTTSFIPFMMKVQSCTRRWQHAESDDQKADANMECNLKSLKELYSKSNSLWQVPPWTI